MTRPAEQSEERAIRLNREIGDWEWVAYCLESFAGLAAAKAKGGRAARLWGAAEAMRENIDATVPPINQLDYDRSMAAALARLDRAAWEAAWEQGKAMSPEQIVEYALSEGDSA